MGGFHVRGGSIGGDGGSISLTVKFVNGGMRGFEKNFTFGELYVRGADDPPPNKAPKMPRKPPANTPPRRKRAPIVPVVAPPRYPGGGRQERARETQP